MTIVTEFGKDKKLANLAGFYFRLPAAYCNSFMQWPKITMKPPLPDRHPNTIQNTIEDGVILRLKNEAAKN